MKSLHAAILLSLNLSGCVEEVSIKSFSSENILVVDGLLTDKIGETIVKIFYSSPLGLDENKIPLENAEVWITDQDQVRTNFTEKSSGVYIPPSDFFGIAGNTYQLFFNTNNGIKYHSSPELLRKSPPIDSIYMHYAELPVGLENEPGLQLFIDSQSKNNEPDFFRYSWQDAHKVIVPYPSKFEYFHREDSVTERTEDIRVCYKRDSTDKLVLGSTAGQLNNQLKELPLKFNLAWSFNYTHKYGVIIRQYRINEEAFDFYRNVKRLNDANGSLFDRQQGEISGNISSLTTGENVLGYFEVSGVSESIRFFLFSEFTQDLSGKIRGFFDCHPDSVEFADNLRTFYSPHPYNPTPPPPQEIQRRSTFALVDVGIGQNGSIYELRYEPCTDCRFYGGLEVPDFWVD